MKSDQIQSITPERLARLEYVADRLEILDCLTRVLRGIDRFDRELFLSGFHLDAVLDAGGYVNSPAQVFDGVASLHDTGQSSTLHNLLNHSCEIDGETGHTETYLLFTGVNRDTTNWIAGGRYLDRFEKREGVWKIAFRFTLIEWSGTIPPATVPLFEDVPGLHLNGAPSRSKDDPSYRRPLTNRREVQAPANPERLGTPQN